ncbi:MAG: histidine kinase [Bacteroidales bacterium]|nr:histidine kinase [Bacteroidales bacterium]
MKQHSILLFFIALFFGTYAQEPVFRHYTVNDGLPDNEVYYAMQDSKGYMWFATNSGVSRYDGYEFENFSVNEGLAGNAILELYEDFLGRIWFIPFDCRFSYYFNGKVYEYEYNQLITDSIGALARYNNFSFNIDKSSNLSFSCSNIYTISSDGELSCESAAQLDRRGVKLKNNPKNVKSNTGNRFNLYVDQDDYFSKTGRQVEDTLWLNYNYNSFLRGQCLSIVEKDKFIVFARNNVLFYSDDCRNIKTKEFENRITFIQYEAPFIFVGFLNDGLHKYQLNNYEKPLTVYLDGHSVTSRVLDTQKGQWFSALYRGVFYLPNEAINTYRFDDVKYDDLRHISKMDNQILASTYNGVVVNPEKKEVLFEIQGDIIEAMEFNPYNHKLYLGGAYLYEYCDGVIKKIENNHQSYMKIGHVNHFLIKSIKFTDDALWLGCSSNLFLILNDSTVYSSYLDDQKLITCYSICDGLKDDLFIGSNKGLWSFDGIDFKRIGESNKLLTSRISDLLYLKEDSALLIGTKGLGVLIYQNDKIENITVDDGLLSNSIMVMKQQDSVIWVGSNLGLNEVVIHKTEPKTYTIHSYTINDGLPDSKINDILVDSHLLYVATQSGMTVCNLDSLKINYAEIPVYIKQVQVLNQDTALIQDMQFSFDHNFINIDYIGVSLADQGKVKYRYTLLGLLDTWLYTYDRNIKFASLAPGPYTFKVCALNKAGEWSEPAVFNFTILKPFWNTLAFKIFIVLIILIVFSSILKYKTNIVKNENQLREDVIILRQKALAKQVDPHFIYNSLNSIQSFILKNENIVAVKYLAKFSKLMRKVLHNSTESYVSIEEEIQAITLYLELERVRFDEKFDFQIKIDPKLHSEISFIPSFFIQPFVENAIWHGLMNLQRAGEVSVVIEKNEDDVKIIIQDNGVGREKAQSIKKYKVKGHTSMGVDISMQRLELVNRLHHTNYQLIIEDLRSEKGIPMGTKVSFNLPFILK